MMCNYFFGGQTFTYEELRQFLKTNALSLDDNLNIDQVISLDSRLYSEIRKVYGTTAVYKEATTLFSVYMEYYMYPTKPVKEKNGILINTPLTREEALDMTRAQISVEYNKLQKLVDSKTLPDTHIDLYLATKALQEEENWVELVKDFYPNFSFQRKKGKGFIYQENDRQVEINSEDEQVLPEDTDDNDFMQGEEILKGLQAFTEDNDTVNPLRKASEAVKDLMSSVFVSHSDGSKERVTPGFVFYKILENLSGIDVSDVEGDTMAVELGQIRDNFIEKGMPKNPDEANRSYAIFKRIERLFTAAHEPIFVGNKMLTGNEYKFRWTGDNQRGHYVFENAVAKTLIDLKGKTTPVIIKTVAEASGLPVDTVSQLYNRARSADTLNSIFNVSNSMRSKFPIFGEYEWKWKKVTTEDGKKNVQSLQLAYKPFREEAGQSVRKNTIVERLVAHGKTLMATPESKYNEPKSMQQLLYNLNIIPSANTYVNSNALSNLVAAMKTIKEKLALLGTTTGELDAEGNPKIYDEGDFRNSLKGYINDIFRATSSADDDLGRSSSYRGADSKTRWFHTLSNQALDKILRIVKGKSIPKYLQGAAYKGNIYIGEDSPSKIYGFFDHEYMADVSENTYAKPISYRKEAGKDWMTRNFLYSFANIAGNMSKFDKPTYIQQFYTISNKPQIQGAQVNVLDEENIRASIRRAIEQEINRPKTGVWTKLAVYKSEESYLGVAYDKKGNIDEQVDKVYKGWSEMSKQSFDNFMKMNPVLDDNFSQTITTLNAYGITDIDVTKEIEDTGLTTKNKGITDEQRKAAEAMIYPVYDVFYKNYFIQSYFLNQLVAGPQAQFKDAYDQIKRMSMVFAQGYGGRVNDETGLKRTFNMMVVEDINEEVSNDLSRIYSFIRLRNKDYDITDAQGFAIPERMNNVRLGFSRESNIGSTAKPVYSGVDDYGVARGVKYSTVEITNELAQAFPSLSDMRFKMTFGKYLKANPQSETHIKELYEANLNNSLTQEQYFEYQSILDKSYVDNMVADELVFASGFKFGKPKTLSAYNVEGELIMEDDSYVTLLNGNYRHQLNPRHDSDSSVANPTQLTYQVNTNGKNSEESDKIFRLNNILASQGYASKLTQLKIKDGGAVKSNAWNSVRALVRTTLKDKMKGVAGNEAIVEFLESGVTLQMPFMVNKLQQNLLSSFSKSSVEIKHAGSKLILQSSIGTNSATSKGLKEPKIVFIDEKDNVIDQNDAKTPAKSYYMEAYVPESIYRSMINQGMNPEDIINDDVYSRLLGFRIPSTELHSAVPIKIIGWYPTKTGDNIIIAPKELVLLHGSDFDIDSLYVIKPYVYSGNDDSSDRTYRDKGGNSLAFPGVAIGYERSGHTTIPLKFLKGGSLTEYLLKEIEDNMDDTDYIKELRSLIDKAGSNEIMKTFLDVIGATKNQEDMFIPIDMGEFNDMTSEDSVFSYFSTLAERQMTDAQRAKKPVRESYDTDSKYKDAIKSWRTKILRQSRNLNNPDNEMLMHQDNFRSALLTGSFANANKIIAYLFYGSEKDSLPTLKENLHLTLNGVKYDGFSRYVKVGDTLLDGEEGRERRTIWQTIDALINGAIDHVKEQILNIINASEETGNAIMSMVAMGIPAKQVSLFMVQPVIKDIVDRKDDKKIKQTLKAELKSRIISTFYKDANYKADLNMSEGTEEEQKAQKKEVEDKWWAEIAKSITGTELTTKDLESFYGRNMADITSKEELILQYRILQYFEKANEVGDLLFKGSMFLKSLSQLPGDFVGLQNVVENADEFFDVQNFLSGAEETIIPESFPFTNVDISKVPNIQSSIKIVASARDILGEIFIKNKTEVVALSEQINDELKANDLYDDSQVDTTVDATEAKPKRKGFLDFQYNKSTQMIRDAIVEYFMSGITIKTNSPDIDTFTMDISTETPEVVSFKQYKKPVTKTIYGSDAWAYRFVEQGYVTRLKDGTQVRTVPLKEIIKQHSTNRFLNSLEVRVVAGATNIYIPTGNSIDASELVDYQDAFKQLNNIAIYRDMEGNLIDPSLHEDNEFNELQYNLLKYGVISQGLAYGSNKFSTLLGPEIYTKFGNQLDSILFDSFKYGSKDNVNNFDTVLEHFKLQLSLQNVTKAYNLNGRSNKIELQTDKETGAVISGMDTIELSDGTKSNIYYDAKVLAKGDDFDMPSFGRISSKLMIKVGYHEGYTYYQKAGTSYSNGNYSFNPSLFRDEYKVSNYFKGENLYITADSMSSDTIKINPKSESKIALLSPGVRFYGHLPSDPTRMSMRRFEVVSKEEVDKRVVVTVKELTNTGFTDIQKSYPGMTEDEYNNLTEEKKNKLIECLPTA